ncbi:MAG: hypothetical protein WCL38_02995 [Actinomycetota bacterium]
MLGLLAVSMVTTNLLLPHFKIAFNQAQQAWRLFAIVFCVLTSLLLLAIVTNRQFGKRGEGHSQAESAEIDVRDDEPKVSNAAIATLLLLIISIPVSVLIAITSISSTHGYQAAPLTDPSGCKFAISKEINHSYSKYKCVSPEVWCHFGQADVRFAWGFLGVFLSVFAIIALKGSERQIPTSH